jgi:RNA polymerase sigma factor (sigma-70 family)
MRGIALRSLRCPWMAEDAVQTAWLRLFQSLETHELSIPPAAWAVMIVKGVCANMLRTLARRPAVALEEIAEAELEKQVTILSLEPRHEFSERLENAMHAMFRLSSADQCILNLFLLEDGSYLVVAQRAGLTAGALRTSICRIRSRLRRAVRCSHLS